MTETFPLIEVSGSAFEMGLQHGKLARPLVRDYLRWIVKLTGRPLAELTANALRFLPLIQKLDRRYVDEMFGLAEGAGIAMAEAALCQVRAEAAQNWQGGCTAFALRGSATADGSPLVGQNQDLEAPYSDVAIVLRVRPKDGRPRAVMFTFAGQLGYAGMNEHGVCHFTNALYDFKWRPGLPFYPLRRAILEQRTAAAAVDLLRKHRTCSAANLMMGDGKGAIASVEVRPEGIALFADDHPDKRIHTNHYLTPAFARHETFSLPDTTRRLARMRQLVSQQWGRITLESLKQMLADHDGNPAGICRHGDRHMHSISGYIAEPSKLRFHVRRGHGCDGHWTTYEV